MKTNKAMLLIAFSVIANLFAGSAVFAQLSGSWKGMSSIFFDPRYDFAASAVNNKIYTAGGDQGWDIEVYDPASDRWSSPTTTGKFTPRRGLTSSVINGKIYFIGGFAQSGTTGLNIVEIFDPATNMWSTPLTSGIFTGRGGLCSAVVNGKIYVMGGAPGDTSTISNTLEVFDPATNAWSTPATTGTFTPRWYFASAVVGGKIYTMGGMNRNGAAVNIVEVFDPVTNNWSTPLMTGAFTPRSDLAAAAVGTLIYVIGGQSTKTLNTLEVFDPLANKWITPVTTGNFGKACGLTATAVNGVIYAMGGFFTSGGLSLESNANTAYTPGALLPPGVITVAQNQLSFDTLYYTKDSTLTAMVHNPSSSAVSIDQAFITGSDSADFSVSGNTKQANLPYSLAPGDSIGFQIKYSAPSSIEDDNATLRIFFDQSSDSIRTVSLSGSAIQAANTGAISLALDQLNFDTLEYTKDSTITAMIYNPTSSVISIDEAMITGTDSSSFTVTGNTKQANLAYQLQPGDSIGFLIKYVAPSSTEDDSAALLILFDQSSDSVRIISLSGSAKQPAGSSVASISQPNLVTASILPNPASSEMRIGYSIPKRSDVTITVFDMTGKELAAIANEEHDAGSYEAVWDVRKLPSGSYILKLSACGESVTKVVEIVK